MGQENRTFDQWRASAMRAVGMNPEQQAQINQLSRSTNIPARVLQHTGSDAHGLLRAQQLTERVQNSPRVRQSLSDPSRLGVAQDDIDNLIKLEENTNRYGGMMRVENSWLKDLTESFQRGFHTGVANSILVDGTEGGIMRGLQEQRAIAAKANGVYYNPRSDTAAAYLNQRRKADAHAPDWSAQQDAAQFAQINQGGSLWQATKFAFTHPAFVFNTAAESVGSQAPVLAETAAVGAIHPVVMAATVGMGSYRTEYASSLSETIQEHADQLQGMSQVEAITYVLGRQDWMAEARNKAARRGMAVGAFDAATAGFAGKLLNIARGGGAARTALAVGGESALQVGGGMGGEATAQALTGEYKPGDIVMEGFAEFATGPVEVLGNTREARAMAREARAEAAAQVQAEIDQAAQQSKLAQRDPVTFSEVVDEVVGDKHHLYLDAQALNQSGLAEAAAKASPSIAAQYAQALQQGGDIQVPQNEWVSLISPNKELADPLRQIARFEPDGVSLAEAAEQKAAAQAEGQQELEAQARQQERAAQQQAQAERQAVEQEVTDQLEQVGQFDRKANQNYAALVSSYVATQAQRLGIPIPEMWQAHKLNIVGDIGNAPALNQALASAPPKGWVHAETDMEFRNLWNGTSKAQAAGSVKAKHATSFAVFEPNQIKSATDNSGAFNSGDDSILHQAARGAFMPGSNTIALLENADLSTTIHELGHYFLHTGLNIANALEAKAARGEALSLGERQHLADMQATLNWLGLADLQAWNALTFEQQRPYHEQLARGFEAYIMEGKAPSLEMRSVFQRMKAWMLRVYQNLARLDVQLSDEVRGVFDRLLASDEEIALAEQNRSMALLFDDPEAAGMSAEEFADYQALGQSATAEAQEQLSAKAVRDMQYGRNARTKHLRALRREAKAARLEAETEVRREVMRQPVYQAWQKLTAKLTDADKIGRPETPKFSPQVDETHDSLFMAIAKLGGLNKDELISEWGFDRQDKIAAVAAGYPVLRRKNGLGIEEMAEQLAQHGYLPLDGHGKWDMRDLEERFFDEHRGERQYSTAFVPREEAKAGEHVGNPFAVYAVRFDEAGLRELGLSDNEIQLLRERKMVNSAHGWNPDLIAEMVLDEDGNPYFGSGEELARAIVQAPPPQQVVEGLADDLMLQRHGELATPEAIAEAADEAAYNEVRLRVLTREYNALAQAVGNRTLLAAAAKEAAQRTIGRLQLKDVSPTRYRRMAAKAARQTEAALRRGDTAAAAAEKRNQILQTALAQAATEARQQSDKIRSQWQKWANKPRQKSVKTHDAALTEVVRAVVGLYGIAPRKGLAASEYLETASQYQGENQDAVRQAWERALSDVKRNGDHKQFNELSRDELQAIHDQLAGLREQAKREHQVRIDGKLQDREQTAEVLREELRAAKPNAKGVTTDKAIDKREEMGWNLRSLVYSATRVESWAEAMGQGFLNYIYRPIKQGAEEYRKQTNEFKQGFKALLEPIQQDFDHPKIHSPELGYTFTFNELLHAMLHSGNESNLRKLLIGRGWGEDTLDGLNTARWEAFINRMQEEGIIQERHWQFVQGVWDLLEQSKPKAQQAHFEVFGYYFDEIAANPIQTPWGEFRGGYVPAQIDADLVVDGQMRELANQENENMDYAFPTTAKGFTKARVEYNRPLVLDLSRLMSHAEQVALFSNMEVPVRDVRRLLSDITPELNLHQHKALESMLMPWLSRAAKQRTVTKIQADGGFNRFWSVMRQRAGMAMMFGNTVNTIQQITGFLLAGVKVKTRYMAAASLDFVSNYKEMKQSVAEHSEFMRSRMDNEIAAMDDFIQETLINPNLFQKAQNWTNRNAYFLQQAMANSMEPVIWTAAYRQALEQGMSEADAAFFADGTIRQTQGSTLPEDISRAEGGTAFVRLFTQFMGYFNMQANLLGNGFVKLMRQGGLRQNKLAAAHLFMMGYFLPAAGAELIAAIGYGLKDDDGDGYADEILKTALLDGQVKNGLAMIPAVGQVGTFIYNRFNGKAYGSRLGGAPALSMAEAALLAPWSVTKAVDPDANYRQKRKGVYDTATLISMTLGLPVRGVLKAGEQADDWSGLDMFSEEGN